MASSAAWRCRRRLTHAAVPSPSGAKADAITARGPPGEAPGGVGDAHDVVVADVVAVIVVVVVVIAVFVCISIIIIVISNIVILVVVVIIITISSSSSGSIRSSKRFF